MARFDERYLDEIKSRLRLSDVIGRTVKLRRQGREYVGLSPFAKEKTPSFFVNDEKGFFHDFSSGKHGDLIAFLQETERLSFPEAVERLAAEAGVPLPAQDPQAAEAETRRQGLGDWLEAAAVWFEAQLRRPAGEGARAYLDRRALPEAERARFRIGYAPAGRTALKDYLIAKGARPQALVEAGLLIAPEDGGAPYDRFRDRLIFPIADGRGRVISFGGRALDPEARAKYLNGPETDLFHKGSTLYGQAEARRLLHAGGEGARLVVVEGYFDAIACQRAGIAAVAPLGTALTEAQMAALWRLHAQPTLCFDADAAGVRAAARAIDRALPLLQPGRSFDFALISGGKDPDDVLREQGPKALGDQLGRARPLVEVLFERERDAAEPLDTPERRIALKIALRKLAGVVADPELSGAYRQDLLARYDALFAKPGGATTPGDAGRTLSRHRWDGRARPGGDSLQRRYPGHASPEGRLGAQRLAGALRPLAAALAQAALDRPELIDEQLETLQVQGFGDPALDALAGELIRIRLSAQALDSASLRLHLAMSGFYDLLREIARAASHSGAPFLAAAASGEEVLATWVRALHLLIEIAALERALEAAKVELAHDPEAFREVREIKSARDARRRDVGSGTLWYEAAYEQAATLH